MAADLWRWEARGAGLNDMFSFHKHGQWPPRESRGGGKEGGSLSGKNGQSQSGRKARASSWHQMAR